MDIGERIKFCRKHRGMTQDRLAEETGIHPVSIRKYETGKMVPKPEQIERIAKALNVTYSAISGDYDVVFPGLSQLKEKRTESKRLSRLRQK